MPSSLDQLRLALSSGPCKPRQIIEKLSVSQPTFSRLVRSAGDGVVRMGAARSVQYALRDTGRGFDDVPVYRVTAEGTLRRLGVLVPVRPDGFVMRQDHGETRYSSGLPWWLMDMRPNGFLGRAWAQRHGAGLGLPSRLMEWSDSHAIRALVAAGDDVPGNLILGDVARDRFLSAPEPRSVSQADYPALASAAERGEQPGSSAGGEQPKFIAYAGRQHVMVKFTSEDDNPVSRRWRDLLLTEHHALETLRVAGVSAPRTKLLDLEGRRFLEIERFDRVGARGRRALHSLAALDAEFVGHARAPWPEIVERLVRDGVANEEALAHAQLLYAFGTLIGNTDMHNGNLSFMSEHGRPYSVAPAYDMLPMALSPNSSGKLPGWIPPRTLSASVEPSAWRQATTLATIFIDRVCADTRFSEEFSGCITALQRHQADLLVQVERLG
jgi:hypothetical protein